MKGKSIIYWASTLIVAVFMGFNAYGYLTHDPKMMAAFASLGYPSYFPDILATAKILGVLAIVAPGTPQLKEWAYAGFTFTFIGALISHLACGQRTEAVGPIVALFVLSVSYLLRPPMRRIVEAAAVLA